MCCVERAKLNLVVDAAYFLVRLRLSGRGSAMTALEFRKRREDYLS